MSLFIRYKNEFPGSTCGTMELHLQIFQNYGKFYWGQYSKEKELFTKDRIQKLRSEQDKRIVFYESGGNEVYVGKLEKIYSHINDSNWDRKKIENLVPDYYREELTKSEDSAVTAWFEISNIKRIFKSDVKKYLSNIRLQDSKNPKCILDSLKGQSNRFYVINNNDFEITKYDDQSIIDNLETQLVDDYIPSTENKKKIRQVFRTIREGQDKFREKVLNTYNHTCCISGYHLDCVLEATHVTPFNGPESNTIKNGICLRSDLHKLWDAFLIAINPDTNCIEISSILNKTKYKQYAGQKVFQNIDTSKIPSKELLKIQYDEFLKNR